MSPTLNMAKLVSGANCCFGNSHEAVNIGHIPTSRVDFDAKTMKNVRLQISRVRQSLAPAVCRGHGSGPGVGRLAGYGSPS